MCSSRSLCARGWQWSSLTVYGASVDGWLMSRTYSGHSTTPDQQGWLDYCSPVRNFGRIWDDPQPHQGKNWTPAVPLRGAGVRRCKQQLFGPQSSGTLPIVCESGVKHISVVGQYQHLGGLLHHAGDHRLEMRKRVATANAAFNAHRRTIFQNRGIPMKKRTQLFHTLILSKLVYGSESWVLDTIKAKEYLHASVMRLYRRLCGLKPDDRSTDLEVLAALQLPSPTELFRQMRLRYLGTLHSCAEVVTWSLLNADSEWCALIRDDLSWMWTQLARSSSLPNPAENTDAWRYLWKFHNRYWKGLMKRAIQQAQLQRCNQVLVCQAHRNVLERLSPEGMIKRPEDEDALQQPVSEGQFFFGCIGCRMTFKSKGGEGVHMCKRHGTISSLRFLFDETRCELCLKEKHTFGKLHNHLRHSQSCREGLQRRLSRCIPAEGMQHKSMQSKKRDTMDCCHRSVAKDPVCPSHWLVRWKILMWTSTGSVLKCSLKGAL